MPEQQMVRPGFGTLGTRFTVTANAYKVNTPSTIAYHYDIALQGFQGKNGTCGDVPPSLGREIFVCLKDKMAAFEGLAVVYDGRKNMFSPKAFKWPNNKKTFEVDLALGDPEAGRNSRKFVVTVNKVSEVKLDNVLKYVQKQVGSTPDEGVYMAITALNVIFNHDLVMRYPNAKNKFFPPPRPANLAPLEITHLQGGIDIWRGYFSSIRMAPGKLILNFDLSSQPMIHPGNLIEVATSFVPVDRYDRNRQPVNLSRLSGQAFTQMSRMLKLVKVTVTRTDGTKLRTKIKEVGGSARKTTFDGPVSPGSAEMRTWTVMEFFQATYNTRIQNPDHPLVRLTGKGWYPMEVCEVEPGQKYTRKLSPDQLANAIRWLTVIPSKRTELLSAGVSQRILGLPTLAAWGINVDRNVLTIPARRLPPPALSCGQNVTIRADNGSWDLRNKKFFTPVKVDKWIAVAFCAPRHPFDQNAGIAAMKALQGAMTAVGMNCAKPLVEHVVFAHGKDAPVEGQPDSVGKWIQKQVTDKPQLIICFLNDANAWQYKQIKLFGDSVFGIATQCISIQKHRSKAGDQYYANVALKINAKLGGANHVVASNLFQVPTMVMGADVTHPGPDSLEPSIAACVGSTNRNAGGYGAEFSVQPGRQEIIGELDTMAKDLLLKFQKRNNFLPKRLIFYRDGVSEGQFPEVVAKEIPLLRQGIRAAGDTQNEMKLTFIVCGKRHHFKFGTSDPKNRDKNGNLLPGVIIDTDITHPFDFDWYGLSHAGLLGTSRAAHYTVLIDDVKHKADQLQTLTNQLCYTYSRATRSVSIATPAYYAHHVCTRIKALLSGLEMGSSSTHTPTQTDIAQALEKYRQRAFQLRVNFAEAFKKCEWKMLEYWQ